MVSEEHAAGFGSGGIAGFVLSLTSGMRGRTVVSCASVGFGGRLCAVTGVKAIVSSESFDCGARFFFGLNSRMISSSANSSFGTPG